MNSFRRIIYIGILFLVTTSSIVIFWIYRKDPKSFGDKLQFVNPAVASFVALSNNNLASLGLVYIEGTAIIHITKLVGENIDWELAKRPGKDGKRDRFDGMPSGHTSFAWLAASYTRVFCHNYYVAIPLYVNSIFTGYSRLYEREHSLLQVICAAAFSEILVLLNKLIILRYRIFHATSSTMRFQKFFKKISRSFFAEK
ncbi:MAG: phosphatase PAP2 family protein [Alphaproteobacteria bacterium]|nr:phosphatase PAP2 family protein [Alphaproteobacteria bacterium]